MNGGGVMNDAHRTTTVSTVQTQDRRRQKEHTNRITNAIDESLFYVVVLTGMCSCVWLVSNFNGCFVPMHLHFKHYIAIGMGPLLFTGIVIRNWTRRNSCCSSNERLINV